MEDLEEDAVEIAAEANDLGIVDCTDFAISEEEGIILRSEHDGMLCIEVLDSSDDSETLFERFFRLLEDVVWMQVGAHVSTESLGQSADVRTKSGCLGSKRPRRRMSC